MTTAPTYNRLYNFTNFQSVNPNTPLPAGQLDAELSQIKVTLDALIANAAIIQRSDGPLANGSVGPSQLQASLYAGFNPPTIWAAAVSYAAGAAVFFGLKLYVCAVAHVSSVANEPGVGAQWTLLADFSAVALPPGSVGTAALAQGAVLDGNIGAQLGGFINVIRNGTLDIWQLGTVGLSIPTSGSYTADGVFMFPAGAAVTVDLATGRLLTRFSLKVTGAAGCTGLLLQHRVESLYSAKLSGRQVTYQAWVFNNTGATITPKISAFTPNTIDTFTVFTTNLAAVNLQPCPNGAWTQVSYSWQASGSAANGFMVNLDLGNNFSTNGKTAQLAEVDLRATAGVPTGLVATPPAPELRAYHVELAYCQRYLWVLKEALAIRASMNGATSLYTTIRFPVPMRAIPVVSANFTAPAGAMSGSSITSIGSGGFQIQSVWSGAGDGSIAYSLNNAAGADL